MTIRMDNLIDDVQQCLVELLQAQTTAPWNRWEKILGYPETERFSEPGVSLIYVLAPVNLDDQKIDHAGGGLARAEMEVKIGAWTYRKEGGPGELDIITSRLQSLFRNPTVHALTFTVTLDSEYADTTLFTQGISVVKCIGPYPVATEEIKEHRSEIKLSLLV